MAKITMADILSAGRPLTRTKTLEIEGLGEFEVHEFPAAALWEVLDQDLGARDNHYMAGVCVRFLQGADHEPTEEEIDAFLARLGRRVMEEIFEAGIFFDGRPEDLRKNS